MIDALFCGLGALAGIVLLTLAWGLKNARSRVETLEKRAAARDLALARMAGELRDHRLSLPPPSVVPARSLAALTSPDWDDNDRATRALPRQPPPLPAFDRPRYMTRGA
jgi:hypothetical protein